MVRPAAKKQPIEFGPRSAGLRLSLREFDRAEFVEGYRYELIDGILVVSPIPSAPERGANQILAYLLLNYRDDHPRGAVLDGTLPEHTVNTPTNCLRADRVIWAGLGRRPNYTMPPTIIGEFVSSGKRRYKRGYEEKRDEYLAMGVKEYWVIDRFDRTMTVFKPAADNIKQRKHSEKQTYTTLLLPGFDLPLSRLLAEADAWAGLGED